ncbi:MAG: serine acetyltransferase [Acidobacteria bacterium RIFCSPLOWO2_12_FULL_66_10]|nr:MAG: serine acetyltransferase [Acidobacteria bacterium RIFCSPLOWO2_12_FULL_66_10]
MTSHQGQAPRDGSPPGPDGELGDVVEALCEAALGSASRADVRRSVPSRRAVIGIVEDLRAALFPGYFGGEVRGAESQRFHIGATLDRVRHRLGEQVRRGFGFVCDEPDPERCPHCEARALAATDAFLVALPGVRRLLETDVQAAYAGDPAATSTAETILCYPGILAITNYRIAHELHRLGVPLIPRMITEYAHSVTGIDIHPGTTIGDHFFIDHGTGVVIGETALIGNRVRIYQGVTLGAKSLPLDEDGHAIKGTPRHPIIEDDVTIYSGATILGRIRIGAGSVIGGNVWVTQDVPRGSRISQVEARRGEFVDGGGI